MLHGANATSPQALRPPMNSDGRHREFARRAAGFGRRAARRAQAELDPARWLRGASERFRNSWRGGELARQMLELTDQRLGVRKHGQRIAGEVVVDADVRSFLLARS
jgi:hypothetical protein